MASQPLNLQQAHQQYGTLLSQPPWMEALLQAGLHRQQNPEPLPAALQAVMERPVDPRLLRRQQQGAAQQAAQQPPQQMVQQQPGQPGVAPAAVLPQLAGPEGAALYAALQGVLNAPAPAPDPRPLPMQQQQPMQPYAPGVQQQGGMMPPADPRLLARQQQQQQVMQPTGPPQEAAGQQRPHRQRPGRLAGQPAAPPPQQGPGVAALQQQMAADPRRRPPPAAGPAVAGAAHSNTLSDVFNMLPAVGPPQQQPPQQQPGPMTRQQQPGGRAPQPMRRMAGLHPPPQPAGPPQQQPAAALPPHMQQQQQQAGRQGTPPMQGGAPAPQPPAGLTQQQLAWGTVSAPVQAAPMLPHMQQPAPVAPGAGPPPRPMQRAAPPAMPAAQQQMGDDEMSQRWMSALMPAEQAGGPRPMQRTAAGPGDARQAPQGAGAKRKSSDDAEGDAARQKQTRFEPAGGPAAAAQNRHALGELIKLTQQQKLRLQWQHTQRPDGGWQSAAFVGPWPSEYPPPGTAPAGSAAGPTQQAAMEAAAAAALAQLQAPGGGGGRGRGGPPQPRPYAPPPRQASGGGAAITSRNALDALLGHFPQATNRCEWQEQPPTADG